MELEIVQVDFDGKFRTFDHFLPSGPGCKPGFFEG